MIKYNIEYDIERSNFKVEFNSLVYYFTSETVAKKFKERVQDYVNQQNLQFISKYGFELKGKIVDFFAISLYKKMERRGFRIYSKNKEKYFNSIDFYITYDLKFN